MKRKISNVSCCQIIGTVFRLKNCAYNCESAKYRNFQIFQEIDQNQCQILILIQLVPRRSLGPLSFFSKLYLKWMISPQPWIQVPGLLVEYSDMLCDRKFEFCDVRVIPMFARQSFVFVELRVSSLEREWLRLSIGKDWLLFTLALRKY